MAWQQLRSGKRRFSPLHFPQDFNPPHQGIITSAVLGCENIGYSAKLITKILSDNDLLGIFRSGQADGIILINILTHHYHVDLLRELDLPFIMIGRCTDNTGLNFCGY